MDSRRTSSVEIIDLTKDEPSCYEVLPVDNISQDRRMPNTDCIAVEGNRTSAASKKQSDPITESGKNKEKERHPSTSTDKGTVLYQDQPLERFITAKVPGKLEKITESLPVLGLAMSRNDDALTEESAHKVEQQKTPSPSIRRPIVNPYAKKRGAIGPAYTQSPNLQKSARYVHNNTPEIASVTGAPKYTTPVSGRTNISCAATGTPRSSRKSSAADPVSKTPEGNKTEVEFPQQGYYGFYAALFRTCPQDYVMFPPPCNNSEHSYVVWKSLCERANLKIVQRALPPLHNEPEEYFESRAALVLEDAREAISAPVTAFWLGKSHTKRQGSFEDMLINDDKKKESSQSTREGFEKLTLQRRNTDVDKKKNRFTVEELEFLQAGSLCLLQYGGSDQLHFACIQPTSKEVLIESRQFEVLMLDFEVSGPGWISPHGPNVREGVKLHPLDASLLSLNRQFHALTTQRTRSVPFMDSLLGKEQQKADSLPATTHFEDDPSLARLNELQRSVALRFLSSAPGSLTIAQGPPGTGKSTLLVSVLLSYIRHRSEGRERIMVCAPTNKAVSIVANRFLRTISKEEQSELNIIIPGDAKKLCDNEKQDNLKPYYLWSWQSHMVSQWENIKESIFVAKKGKVLDEEARSWLYHTAVHLSCRLAKSLPGMPLQITNLASSVTDDLNTLRANALEPLDKLFRQLVQLVNLIQGLSGDVVRSELMSTAVVVFSTLCSAGSTSVMFTRDIDDLIIDEAAAATEPDLCIPFQLVPKRLLIVGDPKQLPSVVLSERAKRLGLSESLHERLMYRCSFDYLMLNYQYRMHPDISSFPSRRFYEKLENGENVRDPDYGNGSNRLACPPYTFIQVHGIPEVSGSHVSNDVEAEVVVDLVRQLRAKASGDWHSIERLRIITFYKMQETIIRKKLDKIGIRNVSVGTVDSCQGCEADVVLVSFVRGLASAGFLVDNRRINVALTRARHQLVCIGNVEAMVRLTGESTETLRHLSLDAKARDAIKKQHHNL